MLGVADGADGARKFEPAGCFTLGASAGFGGAAAIGGFGASEVLGTAGFADRGAAVFMVLRG
jgi:hypothetical protein